MPHSQKSVRRRATRLEQLGRIRLPEGCSLDVADSSFISPSSAIMWMRTSFICPFSIRPSAISRRTKAIARNSDISEALKLISFTRFWISSGVCGISSRRKGLTCTITMSSGKSRSYSGQSDGLPV